jgi:hypothetical protein
MQDAPSPPNSKEYIFQRLPAVPEAPGKEQTLSLSGGASVRNCMNIRYALNIGIGSIPA